MGYRGSRVRIGRHMCVPVHGWDFPEMRLGALTWEGEFWRSADLMESVLLTSSFFARYEDLAC
jgi:hypothetical protein